MTLTMDMPETLDTEQEELKPVDAAPGDKDTPAHELKAYDPEGEADLQDAGVIPPTVVTSPAADDPKPPRDAVAEYKQKLRDAADRLAAAVLERMEHEAEYKTAKAEEKLAAETLQSLAARGPVHYPLFDGQGQAKQTSDASQVETGPEVSGEAGSPSASNDNQGAGSLAWKNEPLSVLDFPTGLHDKLVADGLDTLGRLEQRRADISLGKEKWPKGVGKAAITKIEDAIVGWLTEHQGSSEAASDPGITTEDAAGLSDPACGDDIGDVADRAGKLLAAKTVRPKGDIYQGGRDAFRKGFALTDCCWVPGPNQDAWLLGFKDAEMEAKV